MGQRGSEGNGASTRSQISANGEYIVFESRANNLVSGDNNGASDVFLYDVKSGETSLISYDSDGLSINGGDSGLPSIDDSGRYVTFWSRPDNNNGTYGHIYLRDLETGTLTLVGKNISGLHADKGAFDPAISGDGRYIVFASKSNDIISGDDNSKNDVIMHDTLLDQMILISNKHGASDPSNGGWIKDNNANPSINSNGNYVVFESDNQGATGDTDNNGTFDLFLRNTQTNDERQL